MRPFCIATIGAILGIIIGLYFKSIVPFLPFFTVLDFIIILVLCVNYKNKKKMLKAAGIFAICFSIFLFYTSNKESQFQEISQRYDKKEVEIQAIVLKDKIEKEYKDVYEIKIITIKYENQTRKENLKVIFNLKRGKGQNLELKYGDFIYFKGTYENPSQARNEGGFDYKQYLKTKGIAGVITVKNGEVKKIEKGKTPIIEKAIHDIRENAVSRIQEILPKDTANLCTGLLLGEKTQLSEDVQENFKNSNLSHMLAISGAHVSYILLGITTVIQKLKLHRRWGKLTLIAFLIFFMALVGFTPSVTRSCIMVILQLLASILFRKSDTYQNLAISSFIILLFNPYSLLDIGFQLSFGGTIGIVLFSKKLLRKKRGPNQEKTNSVKVVKRSSKVINILENGFQKIKEMCIVTISANLVILPIMMYHFNNISLTFIISNLLASPILGISLIVGMIFLLSLLILPLAKLLSLFLHPILQLLILIAEFSSKLPFSQILVPTPRIGQIILYYVLLSIVFLKSSFNSSISRTGKLDLKIIKSKNNLFNAIQSKNAILIILIVLIIFPYIFSINQNGKLVIYFIDVGQGDSMLIKTPHNKTILIDGGGSDIGNFDIGEKILIPYLLDKGIIKIDYIMFSHFDRRPLPRIIKCYEKTKSKKCNY